MSHSPFVVPVSSSRRGRLRFACSALLGLMALSSVGCGSDDRCELTATCPGDPDSGVLEGGSAADDGVLDEERSDDDVSNDRADDAADDGPSPGLTSGTDGGADVPKGPGGGLTILPPGPSAPADCGVPNCPDGGTQGEPSDASVTDTADGSIDECEGEGCGAGCEGDDCERGCIPGTFDSTNFDEACFQ